MNNHNKIVDLTWAMFLYIIYMNITNQRKGFGKNILKFYTGKLLLHMGFSALWSSEEITRLWSLYRYKPAGHHLLITSGARDSLLPPLLGPAYCYLLRQTFSFVLLI